MISYFVKVKNLYKNKKIKHRVVFDFHDLKRKIFSADGVVAVFGQFLEKFCQICHIAG